MIRLNGERKDVIEGAEDTIEKEYPPKDGKKSASTVWNDELYPGFTACWDNVATRHLTPDTSNTCINMALAFIAVNRVPATHLYWKLRAKASDLDMRSFLPKKEDFHELRQQMTVLGQRIITRHLNWFNQFFRDCSIPHLLHEHSKESESKVS
ncbi:hypothetical protein ACJMK2_041789 [Sinanodonta woodiana]|uniref:Uncharacterized protein n=1 Tax=Sinanodonta woodiana TaxID=1069815 RepID=A0ABD3W8I1_SINWO